MEERDKTLKELATGLSFATLIFILIALIMIRFGYTRSDNDIWKCLLFSLKGRETRTEKERPALIASLLESLFFYIKERGLGR